MTVVPFVPLARDILREIVELKLGALAGRLQESHKIATVFSPDLLDSLAEKCNDPETGARNVDAILRGSLMPALSRVLLEKFTTGAKPTKLEVGLDPVGGWKLDLDGA
jgi:type VI secretion system protein VasG